MPLPLTDKQPVVRWPEHKLGDLANEITVGFVGPMSAEYVAEGIPFLRSLNIKRFWVNTTDMLRISPKFHERIKKSRLSPGDVVIVRTGAPGTATVIPDWLKEANCADLVVIRPGPDLDPWFLASFLNSHAKVQVEAFLVGAVQQHFNIGSAKDLRICVPSIKEQRKVARVARAIQEKIDLNCRMNLTLENMAAALFKSWFVDFDPVVAKAAGRKPYGMDDATAALFPDSFEESELGPIPRGWRVESLDRIAEFLNGLAMQKFPASPGEESLPVIKIAELRAGNNTGADKASRDVPKQYVVENGDLLFSWSGSLVVDVWTGGRGALNQHLFKVTSERWPKWFVYGWLLEHLLDFQGTAADKATTMGHIRRHHLSEAKVVLPTRELVDKANRAFGPWLQKRVENSLEVRLLATLRDKLILELLSGEIRLGDTEKQVATVL